MKDEVMEYSEKFKIHSYEVDMTNKATLQAICQYLQEVASNHAEKLGFGMTWLMENNRTWMLSRLNVKMDTYPKSGDEIIIRTWPTGAHRLFVLRDFVIENAQGQILGVAGSSWVYMNLETHHPIHPLSGEITFIAPDGVKRTISENPDKVGLTDNPVLKSVYKVRYNDLDMNNHVNNIKYIEWLLESMDPEFRKTHIPDELLINFLAEAVYGHEVSVHLDTTENGYSHSITNDGKDICRSETHWKSLD